MKYIPYEPLFGHLTGRSGHTYWMCFMKLMNVDIKITED